MYRMAIKESQPSAESYMADQNPSVITQCIAGITPLNPSPMNTPEINNHQAAYELQDYADSIRKTYSELVYFYHAKRCIT